MDTRRKEPIMNLIHKIAAAAGLAAVALGVLAQAPVQAQGFHPFRHERMHRAARLDRSAARAAAHGNYRKASRLRAHASQMRHRHFGL